MFIKIYSLLRKTKKRLDYYFYSSLLNKDSGKFKLRGRVLIESPKNVTIGNGCTLNEGVYISGHNRVVIGDHVSFSAGCKIITAGLDMTKLHMKSKRDIHISKPVNIGDNSQIGAGAIILPGVDIGTNVIVGAGAVVTKSYGDNCVLVGTPAIILKKIK